MSTPLGNLIGITMAAEKLDYYNSQFKNEDFIKKGVAGLSPKWKKPPVIIVSKSRQSVKVIPGTVK